MTKILHSMLQHIIADRTDEAEADLHKYLVSKMRVESRSEYADSDEEEQDGEDTGEWENRGDVLILWDDGNGDQANITEKNGKFRCVTHMRGDKSAVSNDTGWISKEELFDWFKKNDQIKEPPKYWFDGWESE